MHIGVLCLEKGGGISHYAYELARALSGLAEVTCFLAAQNDMLGAFQALPCRVRAFPLRRGPRSLLLSMLSGREYAGIAQSIQSEAPDVVVDAGSGAWATVILNQLRGRVPVVHVVHDVSPHPDVRSLVDALPGLIRPPATDAVIALSEFSFKQLERKHPHRPCFRSKLGVLMRPGEVNTDLVADRRFKLLFVGRIFPYKGIDTLVEAFAIARQLEPKLELTIVGRGRISARLLRKMADLGVRLTNKYVSDDELTGLVSSHGVMILPYKSATQSAVAALALANGMPCVATSVGALAEHVHHDRNGLIVPPGDAAAMAHAMAAIARTRTMALKMSEESLRIGREQYSWASIAGDLVNDLSRFVPSR